MFGDTSGLVLPVGCGVSTVVTPSRASGGAGVASCGMLGEEVVRGLQYGRWAFPSLLCF